VSNSSRGPASAPGRSHEPAGQPGQSAYPGQRFGLPEHGQGSVAGIGRRLLALIVDWLICTIIALLALGSQHWTILIFAVEAYVLTAATGFTIGKRLLGVRVVRLDNRPVGFIWSLVRLVLLLLIVPALVFDKDLRSLHDRAAGTIVIRF
jgi:uncharacterized RDD family membrane protein YckC